MKTLAIDTATECCSVALSLDGEISELSQITPVGHSGLLLDMVVQLLTQQKLSLQEIDLIVVDTGPGSFTGVRIGIGVTQGLAYGIDTKVLGVHSLKILAAAMPPGICVPAIDARMGQIYWAAARVLPDGGVEMLCEPAVSSPADASSSMMNMIQPDVLLAVGRNDVDVMGTGWQAYRESLPDLLGGASVKYSSQLYPLAVNLVSLPECQTDGSGIRPELLLASYVRNNVAMKSADRKLG